MKTIEEKAKAFAKKQTFENRDKFYDEPNLRTSEYLSYKAYLAGYQEAQKDAYNQALVDVWAQVELVDKNVRDGRYIVTSEQLIKLEK